MGALDTTPRRADPENLLLAKIAKAVSEGGGGVSSWGDLTDKPSEFPPEAHTHAIADVTGLQTSLDGKASRQRYNQITIPAGAMTPATTSGAAAAAVESSTNRVNYDVFDFDGSTAESVWFGLQMPDIWDRGTVKAKLVWTPATSGTGAVVWGLAATADSDDDAIDTAVGTEVTVADAVLAVGDVHVTAATSALTVGGSPALGDWVWFRVRRLPTDVGDTMTQDARLLGVVIQWRESATEASAW